ncbi:hypothetical protein FKM82_028541 [Ascaphus truei]
MSCLGAPKIVKMSRFFWPVPVLSRCPPSLGGGRRADAAAEPITLGQLWPAGGRRRAGRLVSGQHIALQSIPVLSCSSPSPDSGCVCVCVCVCLCWCVPTIFNMAKYTKRRLYKRS